MQTGTADVGVDSNGAAALSTDERLRLVDVGGRGGLQEKWRPHIDQLHPIMFEAHPEEAITLSRRFAANEHFTMVQQGLSNVVANRHLYLTKNPQVVSLHEPNTDFLSRYALRIHFELIGSMNISCTRYDVLHKDGKVPTPDVIKTDTQGHDYEVLLGFGDLLNECLGIETEAHFYELYRGQKLLHDITGLLSGYGFVLRHLEPSDHFDGDLVEVNAFYTKSVAAVRQMKTRERRKFDLLTKVWNLPTYRFLPAV